MSPKSFVAIDFELMTPVLTSACAVGLVVVRDGVINLKYYSLIKPIPDASKKCNTIVHGITPEMVQTAPTFEMIFPTLRELMSGLPIVCHNRGTDINVLRDCMRYYDLHGIDIDNNICTYEITGLSLVACCAKFGINTGVHHDALDDAVACAKVMLALEGKVVSSVGCGNFREMMVNRTHRTYERETLIPLDDEQIEDTSTPFYHASLVITGTFMAYPDRNSLGQRLKALGADINTSISGKTNLVVMGVGAGPSKVKKIEAYREQGHVIRIIYEPELIEILEHGKN